MFKKYNWQQPIYKNDVINVIINGLLAAILGGILGGLIDFLLGKINFPLSISLILISYFVGTRVRKGYFNYHILYPTLAILFLLIGLFFNTFTYYMMYFNFITAIHMLGSTNFYLQILSPISYIVSFFRNFNFLYLFYTLLELVIYGLCIKITFNLASGYRRV